MRRLVLFGIVGVAATGCTLDSTGLDYQSTLYQRTQGVALKGYDDLYGGPRSQVGMNSVTCEIDQRTAMLGNDYDYSMTTADTVNDAGRLGEDDVVIITTPDTVHIQYSDDWYAGSDSITVPGVQDAQIGGDSVVAMYDDGAGCGLKWVGGASDASRNFSSGSCADFTLATNPLTGEALVGSANGVTVVTADGSQVITEDASQIVAWDATAAVLYAAEYGSTLLRGLEADGTERFATDLGASILAVDDLGTRGAAIVSLSFADGTGGIAVVDGLTGAIEATQGTPSAVESVKGAPDGDSIALVDVDQVHFYGMGSFLNDVGEEGQSNLDPILGF